MAGQWARDNKKIEVRRDYPGLLGRAGGPLRNQYMLDHCTPDLVLACRTLGPDAGTTDCVRRARAMNIPVLVLLDRLS